MMSKAHIVENILIKDDKLSIAIDSVQHEFTLSTISQKLANASQEEQNTVEVSPSGYGLRWPLLDEDLSIDGLLGIEHSARQHQAKL